MHGVCYLVAFATTTIKEAPLTHVKAEALQTTVSQSNNWVRFADVTFHLHGKRKSFVG